MPPRQLARLAVTKPVSSPGGRNLTEWGAAFRFRRENQSGDFGGERANKTKLGIHKKIADARICTRHERSLRDARLHKRDGFLERSRRHNTEMAAAGDKR